MFSEVVSKKNADETNATIKTSVEAAITETIPYRE
jgi:hypothetical protein